MQIMVLHEWDSIYMINMVSSKILGVHFNLLQSLSNLYIFVQDQVVEDVCSLPLSTVRCKAIRRMFYFNGESGMCEKIISCGGNGNIFGSLEDCETRCNIKASFGKGPKYIKKIGQGDIFLNQNCRETLIVVKMIHIPSKRYYNVLVTQVYNS